MSSYLENLKYLKNLDVALWKLNSIAYFWFLKELKFFFFLLLQQVRFHWRISLVHLVALSDPVNCSPQGSSVHEDSQGQTTGVGRHALLQGIFPTQGLNPSLPHCRRIVYHLSHQGSPRILEWVAYPFSRGTSQARNLHVILLFYFCFCNLELTAAILSRSTTDARQRVSEKHALEFWTDLILNNYHGAEEIGPFIDVGK